jgi:hypothetical protein
LSLTGDDARHIDPIRLGTHPCAIVQDFPIQACLQAYPHWKDTPIRLGHRQAADPYPLALLATPAAVALMAGERRRRYLTKADAHTLLTALGLSAARKCQTFIGASAHV